MRCAGASTCCGSHKKRWLRVIAAESSRCRKTSKVRSVSTQPARRPSSASEARPLRMAMVSPGAAMAGASLSGRAGVWAVPAAMTSARTGSAGGAEFAAGETTKAAASPG